MFSSFLWWTQLLLLILPLLAGPSPLVPKENWHPGEVILIPVCLITYKKIKTKLLSPSVSPVTRFAMLQDEIYVLIGSKSGCDKATFARAQEDAV